MMATLRKRKIGENRILASGGKVKKAGVNKEEVSEIDDMKEAGDHKMTLHEDQLEDKLPSSPSSWSFTDDLMQGESDLASPNGACADEEARVDEKNSKEGAGLKMRLRVKGRDTLCGKAGYGKTPNAATKGKVGRAAPTEVCPTKAETSKAEEGNHATVQGTRAGRTRNSLKEGKATENLKKSSNSMKTRNAPEKPRKELNLSKKTEEDSKKTKAKPENTKDKPKKAEDMPNKTEKKYVVGSREKADKKAWIEAMKAQGVRKSTPPKMIQKLKVESKAPAVGRPNLPPLPAEGDLFMPQVNGKKLEQCCTELLIHLEDLEAGESFSVQQMSLLLEGCDERKLVLICEVLEALAMVRRVGSDLEWLGREKVDEQLVRLHQEALEQDMLQQIRKGCNGVVANDKGEDIVKMKRKLSNLELAQKLVMIFLATPEPRTLNLGVACKVVYAGVKQPVVAQAWLAEIATVLVALGLLRYFMDIDSN